MIHDQTWTAVYTYTYCSVYVPAFARIDELMEGPTLGGCNTDEKEPMSLTVANFNRWEFRQCLNDYSYGGIHSPAHAFV